MYPYFDFGPARIPTYNILTVVGILCGFWYLGAVLHRRVELPWSKILPVLGMALFIQYFGGALVPFLARWVYNHETPWLEIWKRNPGRTFHSVFLVLLAYFIAVCRFYKWPTRKILDDFMIGAMIASAIGRLGCFLQGCCLGKFSDLPWAVHFPKRPDLPVHPVQVYMLILETGLAAYLFYFDRHKKRIDGQTFWTGILLYSIYRFWVEYYRVNPVFLWGLTHAQVFSIFTFCIAGIPLLVHRPKPAKRPLP